MAAVYSMGGGNTGVAAALAAAGVGAVPFVAHDLDADNLALLRTGALTAVLHHDLRADLRAALTQLLRAHRLVPGAAGVGAVGAPGRHPVEHPPACAADPACRAASHGPVQPVVGSDEQEGPAASADAASTARSKRRWLIRVTVA